MSNSALLNSSIAKKWWMALTGLFLCLFLVGHLLGNLQLLIPGIEGKRAFNEYAYFMTHNPFIKILSYLTYFSILFHAIDGFLLTVKNKKARPQSYVYNKPGTNSSLPSRYMAVLGSAILIFIVLHMVHFWGKMHYTQLPLHTETTYRPQMTPTGQVRDTLSESYYTTRGEYIPVSDVAIKNGNEFYEDAEGKAKNIQEKFDPTYSSGGENPKIGEGYKDLHSLVLSFFGHDKTKEGFDTNKYASLAVLAYVLSMMVLGFHLWHGFASAFQSLGLNHRRYNKFIKGFGKAFSVIIPLAFAIIPIIIFLNK